MGKRKYVSEKLFLGFSGTVVVGLWLAVAILGLIMSFAACTVALVPDSNTIDQFDLSYYPWRLWVGLLGLLMTAFWVGAGFFGGVAVYFNLINNNSVNNVQLEELIR